MGRPLKIAKIYGSTPVDSGFDNPEGSANTYGVVGGATSLSDQQVLTRVAIGRSLSGSGTFIWSDQTPIMNYTGTDLDMNAVVPVDAYVGVDDSTLIEFTTSATGLVTQTTVSSDALTDEITLDDSDTLVINGAIIFGADIGGLTAGEVYYVETKPSSTTITVSATPGGATLSLSDDTVATSATQNTITLDAAPATSGTSSSIVVSKDAAGYIVRQKGKRKYLVADATSINDEDMVAGSAYRIISVGNTDWNSVGAGSDAAAGKIFIATGVGAGTGTVNLIGPCKTANLANAVLTANTMNLVGTTSAPATVRLDSLTNYFGTDFTDNGTDENSGTKYVVSFNGAVAANVTLGYPNGIIDIQSA
jgi:hypothetical protein